MLLGEEHHHKDLVEYSQEAVDVGARLARELRALE